MPVLHAPSYSDETTSKRAYTVTLVGGLLALGAVVVGFVLAALSLLGVIALPLGWGGGVCVGGWVLASTLRLSRN